MVVGGTVVVVGGAVVAVVDGGAVVVGAVVVGMVVVVGTAVVVVAGSVVAGGIAEAGGPAVVAVGALVVVSKNPAVVGASLPTTWAGGAGDELEPALLATGDPPPQAASAVASTPAPTNHFRPRFTGGERSRRSRYLAKSRRNSRSPLSPTLAGPPEGLLMS